MTHLTKAQLLAAAPATAPRTDAESAKLLDTSEWIRIMRSRGMQPVFAIQGTPHGDAKEARPEDGRHLVVITDGSANKAFMLLNSHTKDRRCLMGVGVWNGSDFLIGASLPLQRWRGWSGPHERLSLCRPEIAVLCARLADWRPSPATIRSFVADVIPHAYEKGQNLPASDVLAEGLGGSMLEVCFGLMGKFRAGNVASARRGRRNVKAMKRPDALFRAAKAVLTRACVVGQRMGTVPRSVSLTP